MKRAFTLLELLVVIGIMGLLGTVSIGGYRAVTRGMEERGAVDNASRFIHAAFQRAMIDRAPVIVFYWNETIKEEDDENPAVVVGKAIAVRRAGRISLARPPYLYDEFADLNLTYAVQGEEGASANASTGMYLYQMSDISDNAKKRSRVKNSVYAQEVDEVYLQEPYGGQEAETAQANGLPVPTDPAIHMYGFEIVDRGGVDWRNGDAYGFEFQTLTLPHNYIFGSEFSRTMSNPVTGENKIVFGGGGGGYANRSANSSGGRVQINVLRPNATGVLTPKEVGQTEDPTRGDS